MSDVNMFDLCDAARECQKKKFLHWNVSFKKWCYLQSFIMRQLWFIKNKQINFSVQKFSVEHVRGNKRLHYVEKKSNVAMH